MAEEFVCPSCSSEFRTNRSIPRSAPSSKKSWKSRMRKYFTPVTGRYFRYPPKAWKVIAVNIVGSASQGRVRMDESISPSIQYDFYDELHDVHYSRAGQELRTIGLFVRREAFDAHIFDITPV